MTWVYPRDGHSTDSKTIYLLGHAEKRASVNGVEIPLAANGNFAYVYKLEFGENKITVDIDGVTETRIVTAKAAVHSCPVAYAQPYVAWTDASSSTANVLRSIIVDETSIRIPLAKPVHVIASLQGVHILELDNCAYDLDWVHYRSCTDNIVILEDNIVIQDSRILIPIEFDGELTVSYEEHAFVIACMGRSSLLASAASLRAKRSNPLSDEFDTSKWIASLPAAPRNDVVCIDPGHGGTQLGAVSPRAVCEKDLNLQVALKLRDALQAKGKQVIMTRETDVDVALARRVELGREADLFISLHHNALPDARDPNLERGISLHYYQQSSRELACDLLIELTKATGLPVHGLYRQNLHVLRESQNPRAVLIELGFIIHPEESEIIVNADYQDACVRAIAESLG